MARLLLIGILALVSIQTHDINLPIEFSVDPMKNTYDGLIRAATAKHLPPGYDWRLFKAQLWQESRLNPAAVSPAGAKGIAQFMDATWREWAPKAGYPYAKVTDPGPSVYTAAAYMAHLIESWYFERGDADRYCLAMASYNAGFGNMLKAQRRQGGKVDYADIIPGLPKVTGLNSLETINYVREIMAYCAGQITGEIINE